MNKLNIERVFIVRSLGDNSRTRGERGLEWVEVLWGGEHVAQTSELKHKKQLLMTHA